MDEVSPKLTVPVNDQDHIQGSPDAQVVMVEYGDYQCPHCRLVYYDIKALQEQLGERFCYVFRHLPITTVHPQAQLAAEAAEAAGAQGKFWEMHNALFETDELDRAKILWLAAGLNLDLDQFAYDLDNHVYASRVQEDFNNGIRSGANGTPTFFVNGARYDGAWDLDSLMETVEKPLGVRVRLLSQQFSRMAASGGILLLLCTLAALFLANSPLSQDYFHFWEKVLTILNLEGGFSLNLTEDLLHWVNDGLMVIFFLVVGLEIKREVLTGELASPRRAALPVAGAIGGMLFPAVFYSLFNHGGPGESGWGVPMATDIAFTLGILTVLGKRVPLSLKVFFTALAIADDLGAVLVIAIFYTSDIVVANLIWAAVIMLGLIFLNRARIYWPVPYAILGIALWYFFLQSGIHPTIAGVLLALTIPSRNPPNFRGLLTQAISVLKNIETPLTVQDESANSRQIATLQALETITDRIQSPAQNLEHNLQPWSTYLVLPIFALANAGIALSSGALQHLTEPISIGIIAGLVAGKPLGITALSWLAVRLGLAEMPGGVNWRQFFSASCLAGIGFTMSLFITNSAFMDPDLRPIAKLSILVASLVAAVLGTALLLITSPKHEGTTVVGARNVRSEPLTVIND
ncbi:MAG: Na+/H+ antiporter NhaA [Candidatus Promineifilaceae bacterium]